MPTISGRKIITRLRSRSTPVVTDCGFGVAVGLRVLGYEYNP